MFLFVSRKQYKMADRQKTTKRSNLKEKRKTDGSEWREQQDSASPNLKNPQK